MGTVVRIGQTSLPGGGTTLQPWQRTAFPAWVPDPSTPPTYTWNPPSTSPQAPQEGAATKVVLSVFEPRELRPLPGVRVSAVRVLYDPRGYDIAGSQPLSSGTTDPNGNFVFEGNVPRQDLIRLTVSSPNGSFPPTTVEAIPGRESKLNVVVCPAGTPDLVCEIAQKQMYFAQVYEQQLEAWHYESTGRPPQTARFAADQAHAAVENQMPPRDPRLRSMWINELSWAVMDLGIPPTDWPELIVHYQQMRRIFGSIPFPTIEGKDWFARCARGIPITVSRAGVNMAVANFRLYSKTHTDYFPREDAQIEKDLAARYIMNNPAIMRCIVHKMKQKAKEIERTQRTMSFAALAATFMLAPMAGGAGSLSLIATEITTYAFANFGSETLAAEGITAVVAAALLASGDANIVMSALKPLVESQIQDLDPVTQQAVLKGLPLIVDAAVSEISAGNPALSGGAQGFISMESIGSALATAAVKALASIPKQYAINQIERFGEIAQGARQLGNDLLQIVRGEGIPPTWKPYLVWIFERLDLEALIDQFLEDFYAWVEGLENGAPPGTVTPPAPPPGPVTPPGGEAPPTSPPTAPPPDTGVPPGPVPPGTVTPPGGDGPPGTVVPPAPGDDFPGEGSTKPVGQEALAAGAIGGGAFLLLLATGILR